MMIAILVFFVTIALLAARFGVDSRDSLDWRPTDEALGRKP